MDAPAKKILVCGDVPSAKLAEFFTRVEAINAKSGPFSFLFVAGSLVADDCTDDFTSEPALLPYIQGTKTVPLQMYFCHERLNPSVVCDNLFCLGMFGVMKLEDLNVGFLWDNDSAQLTIDSVAPSDRENGIDILVARQWPRGILNELAPKEMPAVDAAAFSAAVTAVASALAPRYVFCPSPTGKYFERRPYALPSHPRHATRFIALAPVANEAKEKWIYAFKLSPNEFAPLPESVTASPFAKETQRVRGGDEGGFKRWAEPLEDTRRDKRPATANGDIYVKRSAGCWFCLESPTADHHLIVSIGDAAYLALAKGGVSGDHVIVLPIAHATAIVDLDAATLNEIDRYKESLVAYAAQADKVMLFYERNVPLKYNSPHCHMQAMAIDKPYVDALVRLLATWQTEPCDAAFPYARLQKLFERKNYFWIQIGSRLFYNTNPENVSIHFGRELYARAVQNPKLVDWKNCLTDEKTETAATEQFKARFKPFDRVFK